MTISRSTWIAIGGVLVGLAWNRYQSQQLQARLLAALQPQAPTPVPDPATGFEPGGPGHFEPGGTWVYDVLPSHDPLPGDYIPHLIDPPSRMIADDSAGYAGWQSGDTTVTDDTQSIPYSKDRTAF